jgi:hypothetical protein
MSSRRGTLGAMAVKVRVALSLLTIAGLALAAPAAAAVKPGYVVRPAHDELFFFGDGSNGYGGIGFFGYSPGQATVLVEGDNTGVTYELPALVTRDRLEAHYGDVLDISVTFHPKPGQGYEGGRTDGRCIGRKPEVRRGKFVGTIQFHGELGYSELVATRLGGTSEHFFKQLCRRRHRPRAAASSIGPPAEQLAATRVEAGAETWFRALTGIAHPKSYPQWIFEAKRAERVGRVKIIRRAILEAEAGAVLSAPGVQPVTATVAPPAPFAGSAEFHRDAAGVASWTGSLGVELPGLALLPLTGEGFTALTCVGEGAAARPCSGLSPLTPPYP